jgi:hypothetical protein
MVDDLLDGLQEPMTDPVVAADGHTYERAAIKAWLSSHNTSPMTNMRLSNKTVSVQQMRQAAHLTRGLSVTAITAACVNPHHQ